MDTQKSTATPRVPSNKGNLADQKWPLKLKEIWAIRIWQLMSANTRGLALFNLAIDSESRARDQTRLRIEDICQGGPAAAKSSATQQTARRPVQFEITE
ncbi:integrase [Cupriavidus gilardii]|nr:integrase [Cupriavidus gilardii]